MKTNTLDNGRVYEYKDIVIPLSEIGIAQDKTQQWVISKTWNVGEDVTIDDNNLRVTIRRKLKI